MPVPADSLLLLSHSSSLPPLPASSLFSLVLQLLPPRPLPCLLTVPPPPWPQADERDIFKFFSQAGTVNDIQLITDKNTKRSKGMAYIEYKAQESVFLAISMLNGQLFMSMPLMVRPTSPARPLFFLLVP